MIERHEYGGASALWIVTFTAVYAASGFRSFARRGVDMILRGKRHCCLTRTHRIGHARRQAASREDRVSVRSIWRQLSEAICTQMSANGAQQQLVTVKFVSGESNLTLTAADDTTAAALIEKVRCQRRARCWSSVHALLANFACMVLMICGLQNSSVRSLAALRLTSAGARPAPVCSSPAAPAHTWRN